jgi:hypothetical protein
MPDVVNVGPYDLTMSRWVLGFLLGVLLVAPALGVSLAVACGVATLRPLRRRSGLVAGTLATAAGMTTVAAALTVYALTRD